MKYQLRPEKDMCSCGHYLWDHGRRDSLFIIRFDKTKPCVVCLCAKFQQEKIEERNDRK